MTAPNAPSSPEPSPAKRSKRIYVLWAVALTLLLAAGAFCWAVVVPVWRVRAIVEPLRIGNTTISGDAWWKAHEASFREAVDELGGPSRAAPRIRCYLFMGSGEGSASAVMMLGLCGKSGVQDLVGFLKSNDTCYSDCAAIALGRVGPDAQDAVPALMHFLKTGTPLGMSHAAEALGNIAPRQEATVTALTAALDNYHDYVRISAIKALVKAGPDARASESKLRDMAENDIPSVRRAAAEAIKKIKAAQEKKK